MLRADKFETKTLKSENKMEYGVGNSLKTGLKTNRSELKYSHPLEESENNFDIQSRNMNMSMLRQSQGIAAPLKLQMELNAINKIVTRLPCLPTSNFAQDILSGNDETIMPKDVFGNIEDSEVMGDPHMMMEHKLGMKPL